MGISRTNAVPEQSEREKATIIVEKIARPFMVAARQYHQESPKEFLELSTIFVFMILSFVGEIIIHLPWEWYLVFFVLIFGYFNLFNKIQTIFRKKKKK